jgi:DNA repair protein RecO (recombination protein O)
MPTLRDEAVVLARLDYSETSQILVLFTREHGKVRVIAKGIKRGGKARFAAGIDLLDVGAVVFSSRQERGEALALLTEWKQSRAFSGLRGKLASLYAAQYAAEITARLTEDWDPAERVFAAFIELLEGLDANRDSLEATVTYQLALLHEIGSAPRLDACVLCGRGEHLTYFSSFQGGLICRHCEAVQVEKHAVSTATVAWLQSQRAGFARTSGVDSPAGDVGSRSVGAAASPPAGPFTLLNYHISHLMGREPVMAAYVVPKHRQRRVE